MNETRTTDENRPTENGDCGDATERLERLAINNGGVENGVPEQSKHSITPTLDSLQVP